MATQIHGAGPTGQRSPGLDLAITGYLADNGVSGASPAEIEDAVADYLTANPPSAVVVTDLDNGYLSI